MYSLNMDLFHIFCLICLGVSCVTCAPTEDKTTMYDAIAQKCPGVASDTKFKDQRPFKGLLDLCKNWERIGQVERLTDDNNKDVLCLLFFNTFTHYCSHTEQINTTVSDNELNFDLNAICDKLEIIPEDLDPKNSLHKILASKDDCEQLCHDEIGRAKSLCSLSYYYSHKKAPPKVESHFNHVPNQPNQPPVQPSHESQGEVKSKAPTEIKSTEQETTKGNAAEVNPKVPAPEVVLDKADSGHGDDTKSAPTPATVADNKGQIAAKNVQTSDQNTNFVVGDGKSETDNNPSVGQSKITPLVDIAPEPQVNDQFEANQNNEPQTPVDKNQKDKDADNIDATNNDPETGSIEDNMGADDRPESEDMEEQSIPAQNKKPSKPVKIDDTEPVNYATEMSGDSYFFTYFMLLCVIFIVGYVCYHNKQKILALVLEGRRGKRQYRGRRPNSANYHKLDSNLEEAITSSCTKNTNNVIY